MTRAIIMDRTGGPEVLQCVTTNVGEPGPGEVRIRQSACGVNFIDTYYRSGLYAQPLPGGLGCEGAGVVEAVGPGIQYLKKGDRVAYGTGPNGGYADVRILPEQFLVRLPDSIDDETAAAGMLRGMTVQYLLRRTYAIQPGQTILFHAAAGGVGLIACQWARALGVKVIGTVGSEEKAALARAHGCTHVINYRTENFVERVRDITHGKGVPVVYDSIGRDTFTQSLDCLSPMGMMVSFGNASGAVTPFALTELVSRGSLFVTRPKLGDYTATRAELDATAAEWFHMLQTGKVQLAINQRYALEDAAQAHRDLESRKTTGSTILIP